MRAPSSTFRDALKAHRGWLRTLTPKWKRQLAQNIIAEWIDREECEWVWATVCPLLKVEVTPDRFIAEVVWTRLDAERLDMIRAFGPKRE